MQRSKNKALEAILITHGHWDHYADAQTVKNHTQATTYAHPADKTWLEHPLMMILHAPWGTKIHALKVDHWLNGQDTLTLLGQSVEVRHVPGHAPGNVLFYFKDLQSAFVGDALFAGSVGRYDLPGGNKETLYHSIKTQIYTLPDATIVYPGHGEPTTVIQEKTTNPYIRA